MENQTKPNQPLSPKKSNNGMMAALIVLIVVAVGLAVWMFIAQGNIKTLKAEKQAQKEELMSQVNSLMKEHDQLKAQFGQLSDSLAKKDQIIQTNATEIKQLLRTKWEYAQVRKKFHDLQLIEQGFVRQLDSLYKVNHTLTLENHKIKEQVKSEQAKNQSLMQQKSALTQKVTLASVIPTYNFEAEGVHVTGSGRERKTDKIKRVNKIKVCFTLGSNNITAPGSKNIYVRIARPDKKILTISESDEYSFTYKGNKLQYSAMKVVDYQNKSIGVCVYWDRRMSQALQPGTYNVDVFIGDFNIGHTTFKLR
jgi:regulator of replication initiation timing